MKFDFVPALFYGPDIGRALLSQFVAGAAAQPAIDRIEFTAEAGGKVTRNLALPFLAGMDEIVVDVALFTLRAAPSALDIAGFRVSPGENGRGATLTLDRPAKLRKLELGYDGANSPGKTNPPRLVLRPVVAGKFGPPAFAAEPFDGPAPMFGKLLAGMTVSDLVSGRHRVLLPDAPGQSWLIQLADGDKLENLVVLDRAITVNRVVIAAEPIDLAVTLLGEPRTPLWASPGALGAEAGAQRVDFLPIAQRRLSEALKAVSAEAQEPPPADPVTLALEIEFASASGGLLEVTDRRLSGQYIALPLKSGSAMLALGGRAGALPISAPPRRPLRATATLSARMLGRALNPGSAQAPALAPDTGLRAANGVLVARRIDVALRPGDPAGAGVPLVAAAVRIAAPEDGEFGLELRADAAGRPGAELAPAMLRRFAAGFADWAEFSLPAELSAPPGAPLWLVMRPTRGVLLWHSGDGGGDSGTGEALVSLDQGASWGAPTLPLGTPGLPLAQLFHAEATPFARPAVDLVDDDGSVLADCFADARSADPDRKSWSAKDTLLPAAAIERIAALVGGKPGSRVDLTLRFSAASALELTVSDLKLFYDPAVGAAG